MELDLPLELADMREKGVAGRGLGLGGGEEVGGHSRFGSCKQCSMRASDCKGFQLRLHKICVCAQCPFFATTQKPCGTSNLSDTAHILGTTGVVYNLVFLL
jgi:hypothetical protein